MILKYNSVKGSSKYYRPEEHEIKIIPLPVGLQEGTFSTMSQQFFVNIKNIKLIDKIYTPIEICYRDTEGLYQRVDTPGLEEVFEYELGVVRTSMQIKIEETHHCLGVQSTVKEVGNNCFEWYPIKNGRPEVPDTVTSSSMLLTVRLSIRNKELDYITKSFQDNGRPLYILVYLPSLEGLHLTDTVKILKPSSKFINNNITEVLLQVPKTTVGPSTKLLSVTFIDRLTGEVLHNDNTWSGGTSFFKLDTDGLKPIELQSFLNDSFEKTYGYMFEEEAFKVIYKIPDNIQKILTDNVNYDIVVSVSDSTTERN